MTTYSKIDQEYTTENFPLYFSDGEIRTEVFQFPCQASWPHFHPFIFLSGLEQENSWSKSERGDDIYLIQGSFTIATQGMGWQSNCQKIEMIHLFNTSPNRLSYLFWLTVYLEQVYLACHMTNSPTTAAIHIFNFLFVCKIIKFMFIFSHHTLIDGWISALHFLELKTR